VVLRKGFVGGLEKAKAGGEEYQNWRCLQRLCSDPYLERFSVKAGTLLRADEHDQELLERVDFGTEMSGEHQDYKLF